MNKVFNKSRILSLTYFLISVSCWFDGNAEGAWACLVITNVWLAADYIKLKSKS